MIDSPPPSNEDSGSVLKDLKAMWDKLDGLLEEQLEGVAKVEGRVGNGIPEVVFKLISDFRTLNTKDRTNRLKTIKAVLSAESRYQPTARLQTELVYLGASESKDIDNHQWSRYCKKPIRYVEVKGDHFSIFKSPDVIGLTKAFVRNFSKPSLKFLKIPDLK